MTTIEEIAAEHLGWTRGTVGVARFAGGARLDRPALLSPCGRWAVVEGSSRITHAPSGMVMPQFEILATCLRVSEILGPVTEDETEPTEDAIERIRAARTRAMAPPRRTTATVEVVEIGGEDRAIVLRGLTDDDVRAFADGLGRTVRVSVEIDP